MGDPRTSPFVQNVYSQRVSPHPRQRIQHQQPMQAYTTNENYPHPDHDQSNFQQLRFSHGSLPHMSSESPRPMMQMQHVSNEIHPMSQQHQQQGSAQNSKYQQSSHQGAASDNIKVVVRVRPLNAAERADRDATILQVEEGGQNLMVVVPGPRGAKLSRRFAFNACLPPSVSQPEVFSMVGVPQLLEAAMQGYACTVFAYGQTGSGKTYTMSGVEESIDQDKYQGDDDTDGLITRSLVHLFGEVQRDSTARYLLRASYLEVYNEQVYDLLDGGAVGAAPLPVRWDASRGFFVPGLTLWDLPSMDAALKMVRMGAHARRVGSHEMNKDSSRSHSMLTVNVEATRLCPGEATPSTSYGKVCFVDLAGSERLKLSRSSGDTLKETGSINRSLCALGKVITALGEAGRGGADAGYIPFRDSKLTMLLMDSLGGEALALMIATCSPAQRHVEETLSTLNYATSAKSIRNRPVVRTDPQLQLVRSLKREIHLLREDNGLLRGQLVSHGLVPTSNAPILPSDAAGFASSSRSTAGSLSRSTEPVSQHDGAPHTTRTQPGIPASSGNKLHLDPLRPPSSSDSTRSSSSLVLPSNVANMSKQELVKRLQHAHGLLAQNNDRLETLEGQHEALNGVHRMLEAEHKASLSRNALLEAKLAHLEAVFVGETGEGAVAGFGVTHDSTSKTLEAEVSYTEPPITRQERGHTESSGKGTRKPPPGTGRGSR